MVLNYSQTIFPNIFYVQRKSEFIHLITRSNVFSEFTLKKLRWLHPPPYSITEGEVIPDMVVKGDISCSDNLEILIEGTS